MIPMMDSDSLVRACKLGDVQAVRAHLEVAGTLDVNAPSSGDVGCLPLVAAVERGCAELVSLLLAAGAEAGRSLTGGETPMSCACLAGRLDLCELLMGDGSLEVTVKDIEAAVLGRRLDVCEMLLKKASPSCLARMDFRDCLERAAHFGEPEIIRALLDAVNLRRCGFVGNLAADALQRVQVLERELEEWRALPAALMQALHDPQKHTNMHV